LVVMFTKKIGALAIKLTKIFQFEI
jgi:hypothetical protein